MNRRGFALLTVLWVLAALSGTAAALLLGVREATLVTSNRIALVRGAWAREACAEIVLARYGQGRRAERLDTVDLGRGTWCMAVLENPGRKINLNTASARMLRRVLPSDSLVEALLDWRDPDDAPGPLGAEADWYRARGRRPPRNGPLAEVAELRDVRGFETMPDGALGRLFTTRGSGRIDITTAPASVLRAVPSLTPDAVSAIEAQRRLGHLIGGIDELFRLFPDRTRQAALAHYQTMLQEVAFGPEQWLVHLSGGVRGYRPVSRATLTAVPAGPRLAIVAREVE